MGILVKLDENRTDIQKRVATELQEKARKRAEEAERPDGVDDSQFVKGTEQTNKFFAVWIIVGVLVIGGVIALIVATAR